MLCVSTLIAQNGHRPHLFARHGETDSNKHGILQGWIDVPINDLGRRQAYEMPQLYSQADFDAVWTRTHPKLAIKSDHSWRDGTGFSPCLCSFWCDGTGFSPWLCSLSCEDSASESPCFSWSSTLGGVPVPEPVPAASVTTFCCSVTAV
jgi:hypothetical protein